MTDKESIKSEDDEWLQLGLPERKLEAAKAAFETPAQAQPWVGVLARYASVPKSLPAIVAAGFGPDQFTAWRAAGVDSRNIVGWSKLLREASLTHEHVIRWRAAGHQGSTLPPLVPYLSADTSFDELLVTLQCWNAQSLFRVVNSGLGMSEVIEMRRGGISGQELDSWCSSNVPAAAWREWIAEDLGVDAAASFHARGVDAATARQWLDTGLSAAEVVGLIESGVPLDSLRPWLDADVPRPDAVLFLNAGVSLQHAREWLRSDIPASDAVEFLHGSVSLSTAIEWVNETDLPADDIVDFIQKAVSLEEALKFEERGIEPHQVTRTDAGLELDLDPWQEDPADQLPDVIEPGPIGLTLWTDAFGDGSKAFDVFFTWDGHHSASWSEDISTLNEGLSVMSSSPGRGVLAWPNGKDILLTYRWDDFHVEGHDVFVGMAPTSSVGPMDASGPQFWIQLGYSIIDFVLQNHGGGEPRAEYLDTVDDVIVDLDEMFQQYVNAHNVTQADFGTWLESVTSTGRYELLNEDE